MATKGNRRVVHEIRDGHALAADSDFSKLTRISMNMLSVLKPAAIAAIVLLLSSAQAATITKADYQASKTRIGADYKVDKAACATVVGNAKDICVEEAKAKEEVALAELEYSFTGKAKDRNKVLIAKAESTYAIAKEKCDDKTGNDKDVCVKEAKAVEVKALADAKLGKEIGEARKDATDHKRDADYTVAIEKCDALAGDAKTACIKSAKVKFGKN
ncbi:MAG: hypothetical protein Q7U28_10090 [Aquabacterium sp.]|nr:hypothetical protein [Aquabacterium sp.]